MLFSFSLLVHKKGKYSVNEHFFISKDNIFSIHLSILPKSGLSHALELVIALNVTSKLTALPEFFTDKIISRFLALGNSLIHTK